MSDTIQVSRAKLVGQVVGGVFEKILTAEAEQYAHYEAQSAEYRQKDQLSKATIADLEARLEISAAEAEALKKAMAEKGRRDSQGIHLAYLVPKPQKRNFVPSVNLADINDSKSSAYLREGWALVNGLDTIPKSTGKFHNRTLLADEINRLVRNMSPEALAALA